ncbi:E3 ubiquitin-protein ligase listerin isoform X5 [Molossus molossus]|uniref:E3 ubiquitin-protein ligase listerin isoform X5 n=1 Tax=Molossus molossus TaxID=27622 RepID=UPI001747B717|nr:E3 ubiquitin-protein ligase listerin isoform X5 [Molossus molossus]
MGGKNKQRTKGNLRPSNSGRAAELLAKEQGTVPGFIGFGTFQSDLGYVPAVQGAEEIDSLVDSDFRMVLRKLSKKDVTTKLKAMQEFGTMCTERDTEIVKGVLPYWPRIFCKISLDHDRRVREATQQAFEKLILKVKKHLAPYLKSLMGYWLIAQCDTYPPAASAAKDAFEAAFPPSKQPEAIAFCKDEITGVLQDHLIKETPDSLSDPQTVPEEEREAKFYRVVTCSLLALKKLLCLLPDNELDSLEEKFKSLLSQNKFWKYGKHSIPQIRSAYFELVSALCQRIPQLMKDEASKLCAQSKEETHLPDFLVCKLKKTWLSGVDLLVRQAGRAGRQSAFLRLSALWLKDQVQSSSLDIKSLQGLLSAVDDLLSKLLESEDASLLGVYIGSVMPDNSEWEKMRQALPMQWLHRPLLEGRLSLNYEYFKTDFKEQDTKKLPSHLCTSALLSKMILVALKKEIVLENNELEKITAELLYSLQWCEELDSPPAFLTGFCAMLEKMEITFDNLRGLGDTSGLLHLLFNRSMEHGTLWSLIIAKLILSESISSEEVKQHYRRKEGFFPLTEGSMHTIQSLCPFLSKEDKKEFIAQCIPALLGWTKEDLCSTNGGFGHLAIFNSCLQTRSIDDGELLHGVLKILMCWKRDHEDIFLFSCNLSEVSPEILGVNIEIMRFLSLFLSCCSSPLAESEWDFIMCSMLAWLETTCENHALCSVPLVQLFACVSCDLACELSAFFDSTTLDTVGNLSANLISEWKEFFSQGIHSLLLPLLVTVTGESRDTSETSFQNAMLKPMCETLTYIPKDQLLGHRLPSRLVAGQRTNLPEHLQTLLNTLAPLLLFRARPVQIAVYHMLYKLMPELPQYDQDNLKSDGDEEEEPALSPPAALMSLLRSQEDLLESILGCVPVGQIVTIKPLSEDFCCVLGYLLTWKLILTFFKASSSQLRALYSMYLRKTKSLSKLLYHLFRLMPENPTCAGMAPELANKEPKTFFTEELQLSIREMTTLPYHIPHLACSVYHMTLKDLPAMVRLWWNSSEKRVFNIVDRFTSKYVSSVLSFQEISSVQTSTQLFNGMTVKARAATREVMATYTIEDIVIELVIQLPPNYPLGCIAVESGRRVGVAVQQWRNWMLQLSTYLTHQNGSIMEGLALWKNNVDKRFEGVEDCMICFSVIHGFNYSLPKKACRTCKKKFHSACLYKWFTSSNKSTCPLCRETFF